MIEWAHLTLLTFTQTTETKQKIVTFLYIFHKGLAKHAPQLRKRPSQDNFIVHNNNHKQFRLHPNGQLLLKCK